MDKRTLDLIRLSPVYLETIWGGQRLKKIRNIPMKNVGISREVSSYLGTENVIENGVFAGKKTNEAIKTNRDILLGKVEDNQLIRVAYIDAVENLSIQVHPNNIEATLIGDYEKSESWYILEAEEGAYIIAGVKIEKLSEIKEMVLNRKIEKKLIKVPVKAGDFIMIPAGLIHACGKNMLALEIGSYGGITYRIYDYGRPRDLHLEQALDVIKPKLRCNLQSFPLKKRSNNIINKAIRHDIFSADVIDVAQEFKLPSNDKYKILTCVDGECTVTHNNKKYDLGYTDTIFVPASSKDVIVKGNSRIILSFPT